MVVEDITLSGPRPINPDLLQNTELSISETTILQTEKKPCNCGGSCGGNCSCDGNCSENCACKSKRNFGELMLKVSIGLALVTAAYLLIKKD